MRRPGPPRRIAFAVAVAVAGGLAGAAVGCGREGDLVGSETTTTAPRTATALTEPATGTTPLTTATPGRGGGARTTATTPDDEAGTGTTTTTPNGETGTTTTPPREPAGASPDAARLRRTAAEHARDRLRLPVTSKDVTLVRSRRKPRWAIASGTYGRTAWVVWLRDGRVALGTTDAERFNPNAVPCDVRPAFSEPSC